MRLVMALILGGVVAAGCTGAVPPGGVPGSGEARLAAFDSCEQALAELRQAVLPQVGPYGLGSGRMEATVDLGTPSAPGAAAERATAAPPEDGKSPRYSGTTTHEVGVDEPDLVKTDGRRIVTMVDGTLRVVDAASGRLTGTVRLGQPHRTDDLLLSGDHVLLIRSGWSGIAEPAPPTPDRPTPPTPDLPTPKDMPAPLGSELLLVDLTGEPKVLATYTIDGQFVDARMVGQTARVVTHSQPRLKFGYPTANRDVERARERNRQVVERSGIDDWLPRYRVEQAGAVSSGHVDCAAVARPADYSATSMLTVLTFDLAASALGTGDPVTIVADGDVVYGTADSLYVANRGFAVPLAPGQDARTELYKFDIRGPGKPRHVASGSVPGTLLNQYSLSEYAGHLRVATTSWTAGNSESAVHVLAQRGNELVVVGQVGGLGKGERIYAVRFQGPVGYVVTFRQTDPLYTLDLRNPVAPRVTGELKITGFSAYLHPLGEGRVLGVGQEATAQGRQVGTQVSLFDVSDPASPTRLAQYHLPSGHSEVEFDPHAFLYWPATQTLVVPVTMAGAASAVVLRVSDGQLVELGRLSHPGADGYEGIRRALVIGELLWTVSNSGLAAHELDGLAGLAERQWVAFGS
jgi:uncharacterized secreted protein with C-terminal beta-propeller domain